MKGKKRAIIIGCGLAGGALALSLQDTAYEPVIYEARSGPTGDDDGLFLNTASNGVAVLKELGLADAALVEGTPCPRHILYSGGGKTLGEITNGLREPGIAPSMLIKRGVLQGILEQAAVDRGIPVHYGKRLVRVDQVAERMVAHFRDGSRAEGDILIGCDGIHSPTRSFLDPSAPRPHYTGMVCLGGYASTSGVAPTPDTLNLVYGRRAFFGYLVGEQGETFWFSNVIRSVKPTHAELNGPSTQDWQRYLLAMHRGDAAPIEDIIAAPQKQIVGYPIFEMNSVPSWHHGRGIIIGDAAHATSPHAGQGASMALEDAYILAQCLDQQTDPRAAFVRYEQLRRDRVEKIVEFARRMGLNKRISNPLGIAFRDAALPKILRHFATEERRAWIYRYPLEVPALAA